MLEVELYFSQLLFLSFMENIIVKRCLGVEVSVSFLTVVEQEDLHLYNYSYPLCVMYNYRIYTCMLYAANDAS